MKIFPALLVAACVFAGCQQPRAQTESLIPLDTASIEKATGVKGTMNDKEHVYKITMARSDLHVTDGPVVITPPMGLSCWASFSRCDDCAMVMGDTVLSEDQVSPVLSAALDAGLQVTALHNHFLGENPRLMFMHICGTGTEADLAAGIAKVWAKVKETSGAPHAATDAPAIDPATSTLDPAKIDAILGVKGDYTKGVYKMTIGMTTKMEDHILTNTMGVNTWAVFVGSDDRAAVMGDFAMLESELQPVLKALRKADINVVSIHNHMTEETPRIIFLHYWGIGKTADLAAGLKSALNTQHH